MVTERVLQGLVAAVLLSFAPSALPQSTGTNALKVVRLSGSAYERGRLHGRQLQREIRELVALWKADLKANFGAEPDAFIAAFLKSTDFTPAIERWAPELLREVQGIAEMPYS